MVKTLRAWMAEPCEDIVTYIDSKGIRDAILEAICLDDTSPTARVPDDSPRDPFLVDLAVLEREWDRVVAHFPSIVGSINDVSLIILRADSDIPERQNLLRQYLVHRRYLQRYAQRKTEGNVSKLLNAWYNKRFDEIDKDIRESLDIS